jgi:hypothetical protein
MILDKLVEKKDIYAYINSRKIILADLITKEELMKLPPKRRETMKRQIVGRIKELSHLSGILHGNIHYTSIDIYKKAYRIKHR